MKEIYEILTDIREDFIGKINRTKKEVTKKGILIMQKKFLQTLHSLHV